MCGQRCSLLRPPAETPRRTSAPASCGPKRTSTTSSASGHDDDGQHGPSPGRSRWDHCAIHSPLLTSMVTGSTLLRHETFPRSLNLCPACRTVVFVMSRRCRATLHGCGRRRPRSRAKRTNQRARRRGRATSPLVVSAPGSPQSVCSRRRSARLHLTGAILCPVARLHLEVHYRVDPAAESGPVNGLRAALVDLGFGSQARAWSTQRDRTVVDVDLRDPMAVHAARSSRGLRSRSGVPGTSYLQRGGRAIRAASAA